MGYHKHRVSGSFKFINHGLKAHDQVQIALTSGISVAQLIFLSLLKYIWHLLLDFFEGHSVTHACIDFIQFAIYKVLQTKFLSQRCGSLLSTS